MRPHIDFIQAQHISWTSGEAWDLPGAKVKLLSQDDADGSASCVLRLAAGETRASKPLSFDEEIYILDGEVSFGAETYGENAYAFLPRGFADNAIVSPAGATLLYYRAAAHPHGPERDEAKLAERLVRKVDLTQGEWDGDFDRFGLGSMKAGARMRVLRVDPETSETTYITATIAFRRGERSERHPIAQEFFLLSGELAGPQGVMQAGAYCIRPPMAKHAPYGSPTGALILFRGFGGGQETFWEDADRPFTFHPQHQPILPDEMKALGGPVPRPSRY